MRDDSGIRTDSRPVTGPASMRAPAMRRPIDIHVVTAAITAVTTKISAMSAGRGAARAVTLAGDRATFRADQVRVAGGVAGLVAAGLLAQQPRQHRRLAVLHVPGGGEQGQ